MTDRGQRRGQGAGRSVSPDGIKLAADRARALELTPVSRETLARLDALVALLLEWQSRINLVASSTLESLWTRHISDSLQLLSLAPDARSWVDLGSGAGFPGLVIACALAEKPGSMVHLVESQGKKANFLREAARVTQAPAEIHGMRVEDFVKKSTACPQIVTARAFAPLEPLLRMAYPLLKTGACGLFPKGQNVDAELTQAAKYWKIQSTLVPSRTDPKARIVVVRTIEYAHKLRENVPSTRTRGEG
jgi:16S rRNA (guanine527-N7)-methyltransferase